jgi:hypothetical protein
MSMAIGKVVITSIACALILGILTNTLLTKLNKKANVEEPTATENEIE